MRSFPTSATTACWRRPASPRRGPPSTWTPPWPTAEVPPPLPPPEVVAAPWMPAPEELERDGRARAVAWRPVATAAFAAIVLVAVLVAVSPLVRGMGLRGRRTTHLQVGPT